MRRRDDQAAADDLTVQNRAAASGIELEAVLIPGASALGRGDVSRQDVLILAARIVSRYVDKKNASPTRKVVVQYKGKKDLIEVEPLSEEETKAYLI